MLDDGCAGLLLGARTEYGGLNLVRHRAEFAMKRPHCGLLLGDGQNRMEHGRADLRLPSMVDEERIVSQQQGVRRTIVPLGRSDVAGARESFAPLRLTTDDFRSRVSLNTPPTGANVAPPYDGRNDRPYVLRIAQALLAMSDQCGGGLRIAKNVSVRSLVSQTDVRPDHGHEKADELHRSAHPSLAVA